MKFYLLFRETGDFIPFVAEKPDLVEYYIDFLDQRFVNKFSLISQPKFEQIAKLQEILYQFADTPPGKLISFDCVNDPIDLLDQDLLNRIHCEWVHSNHVKFAVDDLKKKYPNDFRQLFDQISDDVLTVIFSEIVYKYGLQDLYSSINLVLHHVESIFNKMVFQADFSKDWGWIETPNIFPKSYTSNSIANLSLEFNHYGRTLIDKFRYFDHNLSYDDENTFNQLLGFLKLSLLPKETIDYSPEYLQWCENIGRHPGGDYLNIGNIAELNYNLLDYRKLLYYNLFKNNNYFSLSFLK